MFAEARLSTSENFISLLVLALLMVWSMQSMRTWLVHNQRMINVVVMGVFGVLLLFLGLTGMY
jgi:hypothetical protein